MSRNRRMEEPVHQERGYGSSYYDDYSWRRSSENRPRSNFNYWRDEPTATSSYSQRSYAREHYNERWRGDGDSWHAESSYHSRRRHDFGPARDRDNHESWNDRTLPQRNTSRQHYSTYARPPYIPRPAFRANDSAKPSPKPAPPDRPRKMSPTSSKPSQPLQPTSEYLSISRGSSQVLSDPATARKLLVLDLNGTLLIRSPRSASSFGPRLRPVQPRPYMQSFRQYLFCPETKAWLDTMVWSSAQPHSVDDMVDKVFGATKDELKAVWNRKSLGLSEADYHQKTLTTKDLTKPWALFASTLSPEKRERRSTTPPQSHRVHSALTSLLLDDSPHKAALQPYNHVCIPEYDRTRRQHDLQTFLVAKRTKEGKKSKKEKQKNHGEMAVQSADQQTTELSFECALPESPEKESYDATLLAVVGILETVKLQSNVAGWIRKGGLLGGGPSVVIEAKDANAVIQTGNDASSTSDPTMTPEQAHLQSKMWFDDSLVLTDWVARGRDALIELGIPLTHGVTG